MTIASARVRPPRPPAAGWLARPALEARLRDGVERFRVVLLTATAGYGKTALLTRALLPPHDGPALGWLTLEAGDGLHALLQGLVAALDPLDLPWRVAPEALPERGASAAAADRQQVVDELTHALDAADPARGAIVIDDLHHLADPDALSLLARLIEHLPARWTLVLSSRDDPGAVVARAAAAGELLRLREADLAFDAAEVQAWCEAFGLDAVRADLLHRRTGGWAAGLRLVVSGARGSSPAATIDRAAFDYLATEVLAHLEAPLRAFLLDTSVLAELEPGRCTALTGDLRTPRWLDEIERRGLFAQGVDAAAGALRLHDLFRDALQHRLRVERPEDWPRLLARAAALETDPTRRQALWLAAGDPQAAARALLEDAPALNTGGAVQTVLRLLAHYPADFTGTSADWQRVAGYATLTVWRLVESEQHFARAESLYTAAGDDDAARTMRARRACVLVALGRLDDAGFHVQALSAAPPAATEGRLLLATALTWLHIERGEFRAVAAAFARQVELLQHCHTVPDWANLPPPRQTACPGVADLTIRWARGAIAVTGDAPAPLRTSAMLVLGWRALWLGHIDTAAAQLEEALGEATWGGHEVIARSHALALQAALAAVAGQGAQAMEWMRVRVAEQPPGYAGWGAWHVLQFAARIAAAVGDHEALSGWLARLRALEPSLSDLQPRRLHPLEALEGVLAWLQGDRASARSRWLGCLAHEESTDLLGLAVEVRVRLAALVQEDGDAAGAAALLAPVLAAAADGPRGAVFAGASLRQLAGADLPLPAEARSTLQAWATAVAPRADGRGPQPHALRTRPGGLSEREWDVLGLIARGQSNKLIARALDLSPHTVKRHVANVLAKLDLVSRAQAAAWFHAQAGG